MRLERIVSVRENVRGRDCDAELQSTGKGSLVVVWMKERGWKGRQGSLVCDTKSEEGQLRISSWYYCKYYCNYYCNYSFHFYFYFYLITSRINS